MTMLSPKFLVFDSKAGPNVEGEGFTYCVSRDANVQWPKLVRRGRPRKDPKEQGRSLKYPIKEVDRPTKERYEFVDCSDGQQPNDSNTRKLVRTHVMRNYRRQKQIAAEAKLGPQGRGIESQDDDDAKTMAELECPLVPSLEHWSADPFDSFPIAMQPYMHELLYEYVSAVADHLYPIEAYWGFNPTKSSGCP
ncbi:uncharacterized protein BDR25DRAFT_375659 [Lindgomyces ingoldianus]|uniref:Uncharacterized protein n=1 Tax=Lindgomyces ingoldianus TaxID=673940 RepID=A0ACB6RBK7_9PLEO|nr:uncharacterized protein BDR25DRAFT_375659 [Lindgomyces ingoldianus]KAF2476654.1 hypothetical protein BDR25DRAFT_375659 [Lindgomyces ingoldianus]